MVVSRATFGSTRQRGACRTTHRLAHDASKARTTRPRQCPHETGYVGRSPYERTVRSTGKRFDDLARSMISGNSPRVAGETASRNFLRQRTHARFHRATRTTALSTGRSATGSPWTACRHNERLARFNTTTADWCQRRHGSHANLVQRFRLQCRPDRDEQKRDLTGLPWYRNPDPDE